MTLAQLSAALDVDYSIKIDGSNIAELERNERGVKDYELAQY